MAAPACSHGNIHITNLPKGFTKKELCELFSGFPVLDVYMMPHSSYAFVELESFALAEEAISRLKGLKGRSCTAVNGGMVQMTHATRGKDKGVESTPKRNLHVRHLPLYYGDHEIREMFSEGNGDVASIKRLFDDHGAFVGNAMVRFRSLDSAIDAVAKWDKHRFDEHSLPLEMRYADNDSEKKARRLAKGSKTQKPKEILGQQVSSLPRPSNTVEGNTSECSQATSSRLPPPHLTTTQSYPPRSGKKPVSPASLP